MMDDTGRITKEDAVKILTDMGLDAELGEGGIVLIYVNIEEYVKSNNFHKYERLMEAIGYDGSWGLKPDSLRE